MKMLWDRQWHSQQHSLVSMTVSKYCVMCHRNGTKLKSGFGVKTWSKCSACDVPLCKNKRLCFYQYHSEQFPNEIAEWMSQT